MSWQTRGDGNDAGRSDDIIEMKLNFLENKVLVKLLDLVDGRFVIPVVVIAIGVALAKGAFSLSRSRSQDRRDFLDLFRGHDARDNGSRFTYPALMGGGRV